MLVLKRRVGQQVDLTHRNGDKITVWVRNISPKTNQVVLVFDGPPDEFDVQRPERKNRPPVKPSAPNPGGGGDV